jgi:N-acetylmuramoyl-L-alanine amidase
MRNLTRIILHCSATEEGKDFSAADIRTWHKAQGWKDIGYHFVICLDGTIERGRPIDEVGAHVKGHNADTIGVCYIGGVKDGKPKDTMTAEQEVAWMHLVLGLRIVFGYLPVHGHNEYAAKACPSFKVGDKYAFLNVLPEEN